VIEEFAMRDLNYYAGYFDADGSVRAYKNKKTVQVGVEVTNTYRPMIVEMHERFGGRLEMRPQDTKPNQRQVYRLLITGQKARDFLSALLPYLGEKKEQARLALSIRYDGARNTGKHRAPLTTEDLQERLTIAAEIKRLKRVEYGEVA